MNAGRLVRNLIWKLRLRFPTLRLDTAGTARSGIAWFDPSDPRQMYAIPFYCCTCTPVSPRAANTVDFQMPGAGAHGVFLNLLDAAGNEFAHYELQEASAYMGCLGAALPVFEDGYDQLRNPLMFACGLEYELVGSADVRLQKLLDDPAEFMFVARPGIHVVTEGPADLSLSSLWGPVAFTGYDPSQYVDASLSWPLTTVLSVLRDGLPAFPRRRYSRWRLELVSPVPAPPYDIKIAFAEGPISGESLGTADKHEPQFDPATWRFYNPARVGWTGRLEFRIVVW